MIICHVYALGSGNVDVLAGVSVGGIGLGAGVSGIVVDGSEVCVREVTVGVPEGGGEVGVFDPLQAVTDNTTKSINRLIYGLLFFVYIGSISIHNIPRTIFQITPKILHMLLHHIGRAKLNEKT